MALSNDIISQFVKITNDKTEEKKESIVYGTIVVSNSTKYVKIDGSDLLTPIMATADAQDGDRVTVMIKNHTATVTGNVSSPAARTADVKGMGSDYQKLSNKIDQFEILVADKVDTDALNAVTGRIDYLVSDNTVIKQNLTAAQADITNLQTDNVTINKRLTAAEADITELKADKLDVDIANITYATIDDLDATNADVHNLESTYATFVSTTTTKLTAQDASISDLQTKKLDTDTAEITYAKIDDLTAASADITDLEATFADFETTTTDKLAAQDASIANLQADKVSASAIEGKYANIDFSNIGKAAMQYFYAESGLIQDVVVGDTTITGKMVGVTISGDLIEGNTVKAEKLVIKGTDGLYYKLNTDGVTTEAEQTNQNSLDGSVIKAKSITATKIAVDDLVAFGATIGGFHITNSAIYSGVKESVDNDTSGLYIDKEGQLALGDSGDFIKYYKDQNGEYHLEISAQSVIMATSSTSEEEPQLRSIEQAVEELSESAIATANDLSNYITSTNCELENLQDQIDGSITTWFYEYEPSTANAPAKDWTTTDAKNTHLGDLFYNTLTGYCYRWQVVNSVYSWTLVKDADITKAISDAANAQTTADNKRRVFVSTPTVPYDIGDLWVQGSTGDIMRCKTAKTSSQSYASSDWVKASKYTDDTAANAAQSGVDALKVRMSSAETSISQNTEAIELRATKTEVAESLSGYYTKEQADAALTVKANEITSSVSSTYATKTALSETDMKAVNAATAAANAQSDIDSLEIGGRNYVKNSDEEKRITSFYVTYELVDAKENMQDKTVTVSFDAKKAEGSNAVNMYAYFRGSSPLNPSSNKIGDLTTEYVRYEVVITSGATLSDATCLAIHTSIQSPDVYVKNVKVEIGNRATDWTPAPEDTNEDVTALITRVTAAETTISQNTEAINLRATKTEVSTAKNEAISTASSDATTKANNALSSANTNTANLLKNYSTTSEMNAAIRLKADSITSSVSSTYATKSDLSATNTNVTAAQNSADAAQSSIDDLTIGGRNYLLNSEAERSAKTATIDYTLSIDLDWLKSISGKTVTLSFDAKGNEECDYQIDAYFRGDVSSYMSGVPVHTLGTEYDRYSQTMIIPTVSDDDATVFLRVRGNVYVGNQTNTGYFYIKNIKMELGNRATDWTPAPEDVESDISDLDTRVTSAESSITQLSNKITTNVTETTNLGTRMTTVEQTATSLTARITTAESDIDTAQSTANTARTEAANAAKTATNYLGFSSSGLIVGDMTASSLGKNVLIDNDSVDIRNGTEVLASFGANTVTLGQNNANSEISLCDGAGSIRARISESSTTYPQYDSIEIASQEVVIDSKTFEANTTYETSTGYLYETTHEGLSSSGGHAGINASTTTPANSSGVIYINEAGVSSTGRDSIDSTRAGLYANQLKKEGSTTSTVTANSFNVYSEYSVTSKPLLLGTGRTEFTGDNKVLWSGGYYMNASQSITLSEAVTAQANGIVLVFSRYSSSTAQNYHFQSFFVSKKEVLTHKGAGHTFMLTTDGNFNVFAAKYLYINLTTITGNANNVATGTGSSGITYANNGFVLRYVIGV